MSTLDTSLHARLDALSPAAKAWLRTTCERFEDGEGYDPSKADFDECLAAGLIERFGSRLGQIELADGVMEAVYHDDYLGELPV